MVCIINGLEFLSCQKCKKKHIYIRHSLILRGVGRGNNTVAMQNFNRSYFGRFKSNGHGT